MVRNVSKKGADEIHPPNYHQMFSNNIEALREIVREVANLDRATSWRVRCLMVKPSLNEYTHGFLQQMFINKSLL